MAKCLDFFQIPCVRIAPGAIRDLKVLTAGYGHRYLIFTYCGHVQQEVTQKIIDSFEKPAAENDRAFDNIAGRMAGPEGALTWSQPHESIDDIQIEYKFVNIRGQEVTQENYENIVKEIREYQADVVVVAGGGKAYDLVRSALNCFGYFRPRLVIIPTVLATNAAMTNSVVEYNEDHTIKNIGVMQHYPDAMLVDTEVIVKSPPKMFAAGIADCLACWEGYYNLNYAGQLDKVDETSLLQLRGLTTVLEANAVKAYEAVAKQEITHEFENAVSAMAFVNGAPYSLMGCYMVHMMDELLDLIPDCREKMSHGERVAFNLLTMFVHENNLEKFYQYLDMYSIMGLPRTFAELNLPGISYEEFLGYAEKEAREGVFYPMPFHQFTPKEIADSAFEADRLAREALSKKG